MNERTDGFRRFRMHTMVGEIAALLAEAKHDQTLINTVGEETDLINEVGLDSLEMIEFLLSLEKTFKITLDFDAIELTDLGSVRSLCSLIQRSPVRDEAAMAAAASLVRPLAEP